MRTVCNLRYQGWTSDWGQWTLPAGRLLVLLTTLLILVMPVTEHLCNWDHLLRGGQDVEFNLLAALLFAAMVVLSMSGRMIRPPMMQPAVAATIASTTGLTIGSGGDALAGVPARQRSSSPAGASARSRSPRPDGSASISGFRVPTPLRI